MVSYETQMLFHSADEDRLKEWTNKWKEKRKRHPFFLCDEISNNTADLMQLYKDLVPGLQTGVDVIIDSPGGLLDASFKAPFVSRLSVQTIMQLFRAMRKVERRCLHWGERLY